MVDRHIRRRAARFVPVVLLIAVLMSVSASAAWVPDGYILSNSSNCDMWARKAGSTFWTNKMSTYTDYYEFGNVSNTYWQGLKWRMKFGGNQFKADVTYSFGFRVQWQCYPNYADFSNASLVLEALDPLATTVTITPSYVITGDPAGHTFYVTGSFTSPVVLDGVLDWVFTLPESVANTSNSSFTVYNWPGEAFVEESSSTGNSEEIIAAINSQTATLGASLDGMGISLSGIHGAVTSIYDYMCGNVTTLLQSSVDELVAIHALLRDNLIPEVVNGFANLKTAVENGFASTALEIQAQTAQLILTLNNLFAHLEGTIIGESNNIQDAIAAQTAEIKAYLEEAFAGAVSPTLGDKTDTADSTIGASDDIENSLYDNMDLAFDNVDFNSASVPGGVLTAITWVVGVWTGCFDQLGDWQMLIVFPCFVGLILLIIGRGSQAMASTMRRHSKAPPPKNSGE